MPDPGLTDRDLIPPDEEVPGGRCWGDCDTCRKPLNVPCPGDDLDAFERGELAYVINLDASMRVR